MSRIFVDTSGWFSLFIPSDAAHTAVKSVYREHGHFWHTSNFVIDETVTLLQSRGSHRDAVRAGSALRSGIQAQVIRVEPDDEEQAWGIFRSMRGCSFTDCASFVLMRRFKIDTALTLDSDFKRQGFLTVPK